ncbi:electron transporter [Megasphaera cerevisiae DSM 20462]|jgi:electron transport complex protein RnfE|uniref:Ion-translocating oxidoreductase complex subunit E n=1 Tax=Megasphaera cerevisiae DSM 20462 TaxID=1122219 RepID=A0A0J6WYM1_9FIRM|nr:electron transport complex subunit E [Megasphaera cerevisiae]KMO86967.1 electron transporter [Megasphaera cerevisiae DSM 20462]OKY54078.1 electron transport complex subunit RsxE [Megasphaera cerevisiae]SJZ56668.1 electron transport complex protein RnfE [Megasphaera cerevisiae DSM 20462]
MSLWKVFSRGIIEENPYFVLALSLCPGLAVTTSVVNGLTMGLTVWFVITSNNVVVSIIRKTINKKVRVPVYITCIATIVTCVQLFLQAYAPDLYKALGVYLDLVVVFAIILARAESIASKNGIVVSFLDGMGMGVGFTIAMIVISVVRELFGNGTLLGIPMFGPTYQPALILALPPGAFMLIGFLMAGLKMWNESREKAKQLKGSEG